MEESNCNKEKWCWSECSCECSMKGLAVAGGINVLLFYIWYSQINLVSLAAYLALCYIIYGIAMNKMIENKEANDELKECMSKEKIECYVTCIAKQLKGCRDYLDTVSSLTDTSNTVEFFIWLYLISFVTSVFSIRFLGWMIFNVVILYVPLNKQFPEFLFYSYLYVKQMIEGVLGLIECLIPRYEEVVGENKPNEMK